MTSNIVASTVVCHALTRAANAISAIASANDRRAIRHGGAHYRAVTLECSMTMPVASKAIAMMRLRLSAATRCAKRAPYHTANACAGAIDAHTARSILPSRIGSEAPGANAATKVAGKLTTTPAAAARPMLLCIGIPARVITMLVRMPPPTPAKPDDKPIVAPAIVGNPLDGSRSTIGANRLGKANRVAKIRQSNANSPVITLPRTCGAASCPTTTPNGDARSPIPQETDVGIPRPPVCQRRYECSRQDRRQRGADCDMRGLVRGSAGLDQPVKDDRDNDDTAANADQAGEQSGSGARYRAQKDQPKGAHPALVLSMNRT